MCAGAKDPQEVLSREIEKLMEKLEPGTKADIAKIKDKVFGSQVFWVTEARPEVGRVVGSYLVRCAAAPDTLTMPGAARGPLPVPTSRACSHARRARGPTRPAGQPLATWLGRPQLDASDG